MNKKAFEVQFNWLFVLVAGAAILLFFTLVVVKQKSISEASANAVTLKTIEAIITGARVSTDTTNIVDIPKSDIEVSCGRLSIGGVSRQYPNAVLFAPALIRGDILITQTLSFNTPYRSTNLLYITSPQVRYIIIGNNELAKEINKSMPSDLKKEMHQSYQQITNSNNYKVRFIVFEGTMELPASLKNMPDHDVTALKINGGSDEGTIEFYQKDSNSWLYKGASSYLGKPSLIGAVYVDTLDAYECNMKNAFLRLNLVTKIYYEKTKKLSHKTKASGRGAQCAQFYTTSLAQLNNIISASSDFNKESTKAVLGSARLLTNENKNTQTYSCPTIY